ncbi:MAG: hypothetical protein JO287_22110 [Pseudonocardiales bacterium]|nr:hypothetical protein [Pseudonocardiales bacterium]
MGLRISVPIAPGVRYTASSRRRRKGEPRVGAAFVISMAIAIPTAFAIQYWQWTLAIGTPIVALLLITRIAKRKKLTSAASNGPT